jgi:hypothetical protein
MRNELIAAGQVQLRPSEDALVFTSLPLIDQHSINSTDALVLRSALDLADTLRPAGNDLALVASDARLLRAAGAEGLTVFNPETDSLERLDMLLSAPQGRAGKPGSGHRRRPLGSPPRHLRLPLEETASHLIEYRIREPHQFHPVSPSRECP